VHDETIVSNVEVMQRKTHEAVITLQKLLKKLNVMSMKAINSSASSCTTAEQQDIMHTIAVLEADAAEAKRNAEAAHALLIASMAHLDNIVPHPPHSNSTRCGSEACETLMLSVRQRLDVMQCVLAQMAQAPQELHQVALPAASGKQGRVRLGVAAPSLALPPPMRSAAPAPLPRPIPVDGEQKLALGAVGGTQTSHSRVPDARLCGVGIMVAQVRVCVAAVW